VANDDGPPAAGGVGGGGGVFNKLVVNYFIIFFQWKGKGLFEETMVAGYIESLRHVLCSALIPYY
jgi:hypothetical protein